MSDITYEQALKLIQTSYQSGARAIQVPLYVYGAYREGLLSIMWLTTSSAHSSAKHPPLCYKDALVTVEGTCQKCGLALEVGMWPFCPHPAQSIGFSAHVDSILGGMMIENMGKDPIRIDSFSEHRRLMEERGLQLKEKFCPMPGTDIDPAGIPNPKGYMDPYTLEAGAALICRNGKGETPLDPVASGLLRNQFSITGTQRDAEAVAAGDPRRSARVGRRTHGGT